MTTVQGDGAFRVEGIEPWVYTVLALGHGPDMLATARATIAGDAPARVELVVP